MMSLVLLLVYWLFSRVLILNVVFFSIHVGMLMIFDSAPESIKNPFQGLVVEIFFYFLDVLREMGSSKFFSW